MIVVAYLLSFACLILNGVLVFRLLRLKPPYNPVFLWPVLLLNHALSPFLVAVGALGAALGWLSHAPIAVVAGVLGAAISAIYVWQVIAPQPGFESAFGEDWQRKIPPEQKSGMLQRRWNLGLPRTPKPKWERDIPFWTIPGTDRKLLCDVWQPAEGVEPTGLAFIYLHGSAWYLLDKDYGTRPFFRQLTAQGHVVMDVAYRLCPEVDIYGMIGDVKRAVAWMKANAANYRVDPERIVLAGGSAGGHLALLAAYAPNHPQLTPPDVQGCDLSVRAVVAYYGPSDLCAFYEHTKQQRMIGLPKVEIGQPAAIGVNLMQIAGRLDILLGAYPHENPAVYQLASPVSHVHSGCPPTLLIQGDVDRFTPPSAARELHRRLVECGVPATNIIYPLTEHAFDLLLPQVSPPAQAALYETERFLALVA